MTVILPHHLVPLLGCNNSVTSIQMGYGYECQQAYNVSVYAGIKMRQQMRVSAPESKSLTGSPLAQQGLLSLLWMPQQQGAKLNDKGLMLLVLQMMQLSRKKLQQRPQEPMCRCILLLQISPSTVNLASFG